MVGPGPGTPIEDLDSNAKLANAVLPLARSPGPSLAHSAARRHVPAPAKLRDAKQPTGQAFGSPPATCSRRILNRSGVRRKHHSGIPVYCLRRRQDSPLRGEGVRSPASGAFSGYRRVEARSILRIGLRLRGRPRGPDPKPVPVPNPTPVAMAEPRDSRSVVGRPRSEVRVHAVCLPCSGFGLRSSGSGLGSRSRGRGRPRVRGRPRSRGPVLDNPSCLGFSSGCDTGGTGLGLRSSLLVFYFGACGRLPFPADFRVFLVLSLRGRS